MAAKISPLKTPDFTVAPKTLAEVENGKEKLAVITHVHWGTGHTAASANLEKVLVARGFKVVKLDIHDPIRDKWDMVHKLTFGRVKTEDLVDLCFKLGQFNRFFGMFGLTVDKDAEHFEKKRESDKRFINPIREKLKDLNPDVIIPVTRMVLDPTIRAVQGGINGRQIPVVQVQTDTVADTDGDYRTFPYTLHKVCAASDHELSVGKIKRLVPEDQIYGTGYPVKEIFLSRPTETEKTDWRDKWKVGQAKTVIFASGGTGIPSKKPEELLFSKTEFPEDVHVFVLCALNDDYFNHLNNLPTDKRNPRVFLHPLKRIPPSDVRELFSISSLVVGKPGGGTSAEILYTGTKLLTENLKDVVAWEKPNFQALQLCNMADSYESDTEFFQKFNQMVFHPEPINETMRVRFANPNSLENIVSVINLAIAESRDISKKGVWQKIPEDFYKSVKKPVQKFFESMQKAPLDHQPNCLEELGVMLTKPFTWSVKLWNSTKGGLIKNIAAIALAIFLSPFMLLGLGIYGLGKLLPHQVKTLTDSILPRSSPQVISDLLQGLKLLDEELSNRKIPYLAASETLKGLVDRQGLFPWDKKAFIRVRDRDVPYLMSEFKKAMLEKGFDLVQSSNGNLILRPISKGREVGEIELRVSEQREDGHWVYANGEMEDDIVSDQDFHAEHKKPLGPHVSLNTPLNPEENLLAVFGPNWQSEATYTKDFITLRVTISDKNSAKGRV